MSLPDKIEFGAIIAAGGSGLRFAGEKAPESTPKQYLHLGGLPLYAWSLSRLSREPSISQLVLVVPSHLVQFTEAEIETLRDKHKLSANIQVISGGKSRQASVFLGLQKLAATADPPEYALIHDAARPFLDSRTIKRVIEGAIEYGACTTGAPVSDTIKRVSGCRVIETIPRSDLVAVQTPQAARFKDLLRAHEKAAVDGFATTDDAALLEWAGHDVYVVEGPSHNMKITTREDLILAEALEDYLFRDHL